MGIFGGLVLLWTIVIWNITHGVAGIRSAAGAPSGTAKTVGIIAGVGYGLVFALANFVNPKPREMTVTIPPDRFLKK